MTQAAGARTTNPRPDDTDRRYLPITHRATTANPGLPARRLGPFTSPLTRTHVDRSGQLPNNHEFTVRSLQQAAVTPAQRLAVALAAVHAARAEAIRALTLDDIDLRNWRVTIAGHRQRLGELTHNALVAWLGYRRATWPDTANRHVLVSRISALGAGPVSVDYLDKHQLRGVSLEHIRRDRIGHEALTTGADPLHPALVFNIDHTNAMAYTNAARNLLSVPVEGADVAVL